VPGPADIGISTSAWSDRLLDHALSRIAGLGRFAEVRSFGLHTLLSRRSRAAVLASGLPCTVHGPFDAIGLGTLDDDERMRVLDTHRRHLEAAAKVGARLYVAHPDWAPADGPRDPLVADALQRSFQALRDLQDEFGVEVAVENMPAGGSSHYVRPGELDLGGLGVVLDVGHASIAGCLQEWLADPRAPLRHLHLHDNRGTTDVDDPHAALGTGVVDVAAVVVTARAAGATMVLEHYREADVRASLDHLRRLGLVA
jgi:sugar phosphate isomerase/epimerase